MLTIGLDIGGANLKAASSAGQSLSQNFDLWRAPERLGTMLESLLCRFPAPGALAVTMTGELADCFQTKSEGVHSILAAVERVAGPATVLVWQTGGCFVSPEQARREPVLVAAANWHALATWAGRLAGDGAALLMDVGSTTTDLIPIWNGVPVPHGRTDTERLLHGELVYTGVRRTPLCAVAPTTVYREQACPLAAELFATTLDVYLTLGATDEDVSDCNTANGRPATRAAARDRLARMICCDRTEFTDDDALLMARHFAAAQQRVLAGALGAVLAGLPEACRTVFISGSGGFLAEQVLRADNRTCNSRFERLAARFSPGLAEAACAYAAAILAEEFRAAG